MRRVVNTPDAQSDLENIWLYSFEQWGERQADKYFDELIEGIELLSSNPLIGKPCDDIRENFRSFQIRRHFIFYRLLDQQIEIVRVLHERMMPDRFFKI